MGPDNLIVADCRRVDQLVYATPVKKKLAPAVPSDLIRAFSEESVRGFTENSVGISINKHEEIKASSPNITSQLITNSSLNGRNVNCFNTSQVKQQEQQQQQQQQLLKHERQQQQQRETAEENTSHLCRFKAVISEISNRLKYKHINI